MNFVDVFRTEILMYITLSDINSDVDNAKAKYFGSAQRCETDLAFDMAWKIGRKSSCLGYTYPTLVAHTSRISADELAL